MYFLGIEAFLAIVQTQSLTKAAELLNLSQSTVSYRLKMLEQDMGAVLIERGKGIQNINLTPFGETFTSIAERWNALKRETEILQATGPKLSLSIGSADSLSVYILPPLYQALSQYSSQMNLQIRTQHTPESYDSVERQEIDVAFVKMERVSPNIVVEPFYIDEMVLIRLAALHNNYDTVVSPDELDSEYELYMNWGPPYQMWHDRWWDPYLPSRIRLDTAALIFSLMWDDRQWAIVPKSIADAFLKSGRFVTQHLSDPAPPRTSYKITHRYPNLAASQSLMILNQCIDLIFAKKRECAGL